MRLIDQYRLVWLFDLKAVVQLMVVSSSGLEYKGENSD